MVRSRDSTHPIDDLSRFVCRQSRFHVRSQSPHSVSCPFVCRPNTSHVERSVSRNLPGRGGRGRLCHAKRAWLGIDRSCRFRTLVWPGCGTSYGKKEVFKFQKPDKRGVDNICCYFYCMARKTPPIISKVCKYLLSFFVGTRKFCLSLRMFLISPYIFLHFS